MRNILSLKKMHSGHVGCQCLCGLGYFSTYNMVLTNSKTNLPLTNLKILSRSYTKIIADIMYCTKSMFTVYVLPAGVNIQNKLHPHFRTFFQQFTIFIQAILNFKSNIFQCPLWYIKSRCI